MAKSKEVTVEERLRSLYDLQLIDSRIDEIRNVRGELPLEVSDLEDEVAGLNIRLEKLSDSLALIDSQISDKKNYFFRCELPLYKTVCEKMKCRQKKFGIGKGSTSSISSLKKFVSDDIPLALYT